MKRQLAVLTGPEKIEIMEEELQSAEYKAIFGFCFLRDPQFNEAVKNGTVAEYANEIFANVRIETCE